MSDETKPLWPMVPFAFPFDVTVNGERHVNPGMMLRDYLAGQAIAEAYRQALEAKPERYVSDELPNAEALAADIAYRLADACMKARSK